MEPYFDTNILIAYYCPEPLSSRAEQAITSFPRPLVISRLTEVEFYSAIAKKVRNNQNRLTEKEAHEVIDKFKSHLTLQHYKMKTLRNKHYDLASNLRKDVTPTLPLTTLDALHLAFTKLEHLTLYTSDRKLAISANLSKVNCEFIKE